MKPTLYVLFFSLSMLVSTLARAQTTFTVTNTNDAGSGSLRQAMLNVAASNSAGPFTITATAISGTINLASVLPDIVNNITFTGPGASSLTVRRNSGGNYRIFNIPNTNTVSFNGFTIANGFADQGNGGGIQNSGILTLSNCVFQGNRAASTVQAAGGAVSNRRQLTVNNCTFTGNGSLTASSLYGGGIGHIGDQLVVNNSVFSGNSADFLGGGIYITGSTSTITNCLFVGNSSPNGAGVIFQGNPVATFTNCTFSGNQASVRGVVTSFNGGTQTFINTTITANTGGAGAVFNEDRGAAIILKNCIVAGNEASIYGRVDATSSYNVIGTGGSGGLTNGVNNNIVGVDALLAPLANYGGTTQTHALLPGSPAINAGTSSGAPTTDQRGISRVGATDIGAFESRGFTISRTSGNSQSATVNTAFANPLVVSVSSASSEPVAGGVVTFAGPASGASTNPASVTASIAGTTATRTVTANATSGGPYNVTASANGSTTNQIFTLINNAVICTSLYTVTNTNDAGAGSLRQAMLDVAATTCPAPFTITATVSGTINLASVLPDITQDIVFMGPGAINLTVRRSTGGDYRIFNIPNNNTVSFTGFTIADGNANTGGGIASRGPLSLSNCILRNNTASVGGGVYGGAATSLTNCLLVGNSAGNAGGGVGAETNLNLTNCTFSNNSAGQGGGVYMDAGTGLFVNATFSENKSNSGGGVNIWQNATPTFTNCLIVGNTNAEGTAPNDVFQSGSVSPSSAYNVIGAVINNIQNLRNGVNNNQVGVTALLGGLANYGGGLPTYALLPGSPAINAGTASGAPATDARGLGRVGVPDVGAFESQGFSLALTAGDSQSAFTGAAFESPLTVSVSSANAEPVAGGVVTFTGPASGASTNPTSVTASIAGTTATVSVTANTTAGGPYSVTASIRGATSSVAFNLTNRLSSPIRYVKQGGTGSGNSWADASGDLQSQINFSGTQQVWVAAGIYKPTTGTDRDVSFSLKNGVAVYGGFVGTETSLSQRGLVSPVTGSPSSSTLSGDIGVVGDNADNSYHVLYNSGLNRTAVLDGFLICGGHANGDRYPFTSGGGMFNERSSPSITNCSFVNDFAYYGGGMYNASSSPSLTNCAFQNNSIGGYGGGMYNDNSSPSLTNCAFQNNSADGGGGGVYNRNSSPSLTNCSFQNNAAAVYYGGGMANERSSNPSLTNCSFVYNSAYSGGGMYNFNSSSPSLTNCVLFGNGSSKTIYNDGSAGPLLRYSLIEASVTGYTDGGNNLTTTTSPFASTSSAQLSNCSTAINAGLNSATGLAGVTTDLEGNPRFFNNGTVDMGAYEYQGEPIRITLSNPTTTTATQSVAFSQSFTVVGGSGPYSFSVVEGSLPGGLSLATTGELSGTPTQAGSYSITVRATDANGCAGTGAVYSLTVSAAIPTIAGLSASPAAVCAGSPVTFTATVGNVTGNYNYTLTNGSSTSIDGASTSPAFSQSLTAGGSGAQSFTLTVNISGQITTATTSLTVTTPPSAAIAYAGSPFFTSSSPVSVSQTGTPGGSYSSRPAGLSLSPTTGQLTPASSSPGTYTVTYTVEGSSGCAALSTTTSVEIQASTPIRYVKQGGTGSGSSWADASGDLQSQINLAGTQQVWVAAGIYKPTSTTARDVSFSLKNGVAVYGGFVGTETALSQRGTVNPVTGSPSSSTLSGDIGVVGDNTDNSYHVVSNIGLNRTAVLDGFLISGGYARVSSFIIGSGGGMINGRSSPSLTNCSFVDNSADLGGGMYNVENSSPSLTNCSFVGNTSSSYGGGMMCAQDASLTLTNCSFVNNSADIGGGMANIGSSPSLTNCSFVGNYASSQGGGMCNYNCTPSLTNCVLFGNGGSETILNSDAGPLLRYSLIEASVTGYTDGGNNITTATNPFASTSSAQLSNCSPAINAGSNQAYATANGPATDLAGNTRVFGGTIDMGAYEYQGEPTRITVSNPTTTAATPWVAFSQRFSALGGVEPYSFSVVGGSLPGGLSLATTGELSGTPTQAGSYSITVRATDANGCVGMVIYSLVVTNAIPTIAGLSASPAAVCVGSSVTFTATVGNVTGSYTYTLTNGSSPLSGTATSTAFSQSLTASGSGTQSFSLIVSASGQTAIAATSLTVNALPVANLTNNGPLTCAQTSVTLTASGGTSYIFSTGANPIGTSNQATVTTAGTYSVTVINGVNGCSSVASTAVDQAATTRLTWTGQTSTDWNTAGNWCPARVPLSTDDVVIPATPPNKPVLGTNAVANSVEVQSGASLAITNAGILSLNGSRLIGTNTVTLFTSGTVVNSGQVVVGNLSSATVGQLGVLNQGVFQNNTGGSIRIDRTTSHGFQNTGTATATNSATITVGQSASIGGIGIRSNNTASFSNTAGGYIQIDNTGGNGIELIGGTFTNAAVVRIGSVSTISGGGINVQGNSVFTNAIGGDISVNRTGYQGVQSFATFVNASTLTIGNIAFSSQDNIENQGTFINTATGVINADRTANRNGNGIWNVANTFTNSGTIIIRFLSIASGNGILNTGTSFANLAGGRIQLDRVFRGVVNRTAFTNAGEIRMGYNAPLGELGIQNTTNNALFTNLAGGVIGIDQMAYTRDGITNESGNTFTNSGTISIGTSSSIGGNGITNAGTLNNSACATLTVFDNVANSGSFTNAGLLTVSTTQPHTNTGSFINTGDIDYPQGNPIPNVTNRNPFDVPVIGCVSGISPALQLGENSSQLTIGTTWYKDPALTQPAGSYDQVSNTFTPSNLTAGSTTILYFSVTYGANACTKTKSVTVTLNPQVTASISPESAALTCASPTVSLTASGGTSYIWDDSSTNPVRTVSVAGTYSVTVLSNSACSAVASTTVTSNTATIAVSNPTVAIATQGAGFSQRFSASGGVEPYSFSVVGGSLPGGLSLATTGELSGTPTQAGSYSIVVRATDANGCAGTGAAYSLVVTNATPTIAGLAASPAAICVGSPVTFTATVGNVTGSYAYTLTNGSSLLSGTANTTAFSQSLTASGSGLQSYTLTVENNGQRLSASTTLAVNAPPTATLVSSGMLTCTSPSVTLTAGGGSSYTFTGPGLTASGSSNQQVVSQAGIYSVLVTNASGCTATASVNVSADQTAPSLTINPSSATLTCASPTASLTAVGSGNVRWSTGSTDRTISVSAAGVYSVTLTSPSGCTTSASVSVTADQSTPSLTINPSSATLTCASPTASLTVVGTGTVRWSTGSTDRSISVSSAGVYSVTLTSPSGCTTSASVSVTADQTAPSLTVNPSSATLTCANPTTSLTVVGSGTYRWSTGSTDQTISVSAAGIYSVTLTSPSGCTTSASVSVTADQTAPSLTITPSSATLTCASPTASLTAVGSGSVRWNTGSTDRTITVSRAGVYSVTLTSPSGCTTSASVSVTADQSTPSLTINPSSATLTCASPTASLTVVGTGTVRWNTGSTDRSISVSSAGVYSVTLTSPSGCTSSSSVNVTADQTAPSLTVNPSNVTLTCASPTASLTAVGNGSVRWSTGSTDRSITVSSAGVYSVTLTSPSGCTSSASVNVTADQTAPSLTINPSSATLTCASPTASLTAVGSGSVRWNTGSTDQVITVSSAGVYSVTLTSPSGCTSSASVSVSADQNAPSLTISPSSATLTCASPTASLTAVGIGSVRWNTGSTDRSISVSSAGVYSVTLTSPSGCTSSSSVNVTADQTAPSLTINPSSATLTCASPTASLTAVGSGSVRWSTGSTDQVITVSSAGVYSVTLTSPSGCTTSTSVNVTADQTATGLSLTNDGPLACAPGSFVTLSANGAPAGASFRFSTGATQVGSTNAATVATAGIYSVTATAPNGCLATATTTVTAANCGFAISGVTTIRCETVNPARGEQRVTFAPQYTGLTNEPVNFSIVNELGATTAAGPYTLRLYSDNPTITLVAQQGGATTTYRYNWLAGCEGTTPPVDPVNTPPVVVSPIPAQSATVGQPFSYGIPGGTFTDAQTPTQLVLSVTGLPAGLSFTAPATISGTPSVSGITTVTVTATDPGGLSVRTQFTLTVQGNQIVTPPSGFAIGGVTTIRCETVDAARGERRVTFTPQYTGLTGEPVSFSIVNELGATTAAGPYTLRLYSDNPVITLVAQQGGVSSRFSYNWLSGCGSSQGRLGVPAESTMQVRVLGNPLVGDELVVVVSGAAGQRLRLGVVDERGYPAAPDVEVAAASTVERVVLRVGGSGGVYLLQVQTPTQRQTIKVIKQ